MLTIMDKKSNRTCQGMGRREFMRIGGGLHCSTMRIWRELGPFLDD